ncbi:TraB/GumN family protein [Vibrio palustris]|uniref:TraB family protein n=1 Tax=Vibrio palustris TaxID=1918946 RepID=A0A1R4B037_9VIBR|nr:TraB/GumN family protein [Vibrio palustris]SJL82274.1 TraB family protein [Vibrio palustris]
MRLTSSIGLIASILTAFSFSSKAEPLYWHLTKGERNIYVIGSVHVGTQSMYPLPDTITQALTHSDGLIVETDIRHASNISYPKQTVKTEDVLNEQQLSTLDSVTQQLGVNSQQYRTMSPWAAALSIQTLTMKQLGYDATQGVDSYLLAQATRQHTPVLGLESLQSQINLLTQQSDQGKSLLLSAIKDWKKNRQVMQCLIKSWTSGDEKHLWKFAQTDQLSDGMQTELVDARNTRWVNELTSSDFYPNTKGTYVMVVGVLHLIGPNNVLSQLEQRGFNVEKLNKTKSVGCKF